MPSVTRRSGEQSRRVAAPARLVEATERLRGVSRNHVRYVELPEAEHAFDLWPSERTARISEGIGRFLTAIADERG